jgi:REP-associated tyrosine transposase
MANYRRNFLPGGSYFFTVNLADRRRALLTDHVDLLRAASRQVRARHPFAIEAAVILPDHLHAISTLPDGDADFATRWRLIKSGFGSGGIGSIRCATRTILPGTSITFTSIR